MNSVNSRVFVNKVVFVTVGYTDYYSMSRSSKKYSYVWSLMANITKKQMTRLLWQMTLRKTIWKKLLTTQRKYILYK
ncbi:unnamed protein product [Arctia plantaginis]|uniref:Uncharacterized protein n=1 Tax=Arctia plantaginis TaxID=874455 RepID=A0A8S1BND5_ARCPL|nr:unnamed protein product [Arctia plantaginis]